MFDSGISYWILDEHGQPVRTDRASWVAWLNRPENRVIAQTTQQGYLISTIFDGLNRRFETMVFKGCNRRKGLRTWFSGSLVDSLEDHEQGMIFVEQRVKLLRRHRHARIKTLRRKRGY